VVSVKFISLILRSLAFFPYINMVLVIKEEHLYWIDCPRLLVPGAMKGGCFVPEYEAYLWRGVFVLLLPPPFSPALSQR
jgi:hypothetical protein